MGDEGSRSLGSSHQLNGGDEIQMWPVAQQTAAGLGLLGRPGAPGRGRGRGEGVDSMRGSGWPRLRPRGAGVPPFPAQGPLFQGPPRAGGRSCSNRCWRKHVTSGCCKFRIAFKWMFILLIISSHALVTNGRRCVRRVDSVSRQGLARTCPGGTPVTATQHVGDHWLSSLDSGFLGLRRGR